jgi:hypothetical protein
LDVKAEFNILNAGVEDQPNKKHLKSVLEEKRGSGVYRCFRWSTSFFELRLMSRYTKGFRRFITATTALIVTGWSVRCRIGI